MILSSNTVFSTKPFNRIFVLGAYTAHVFFNPVHNQYPFCLNLYDNTQNKCIYVGYFSSVLQLSNHVSTYVVEKYTDNNIEYDKDFLSVSIGSMSDTLDMLCYDKVTEDENLIQHNMFSSLEIKV